MACAGRGSGGDAGAGTAASPSGADLARAHALCDAGAPLPERAEVLALAQSLEARAVKEGTGARAVELHVAAATLYERSWRIEGHEQDAKEALELYRAGAKDIAVAGACEAAVRGGVLAGDVARDASATYAELYRVQRRSAASAPSCGPAIEAVLATMTAFRPPARVLEAIDEGLAGEGAIAAAIADAGRPLAAPQLVRIEQWSGREAARVVLVLDRPAKFRAGDEAGAGGRLPRTFVELDGVALGSTPRDVPISGIVTRIVAQSTTSGARVSLDLDGHAYRRVFYLPEPFRVVVDIARHPPGVAENGRRTVARVVLDPGHGGYDPGAIGPTGVKEKDVTLDVAHRVAPVLAKEGVQVVLTRDDDRFISLEERTARANAFGADLFISIHCNANDNGKGRGVETYVLDTTRDDISDRVAARENATSTAANAELGSILANMRLADQASRSTKLAELLQRSALASLRMRFPDVHDGGLHTAGFYVLVGARMPSVLFETSYVSNPIEEQRLASEDYRQRLADAIVNAVKAYREGR
jgi:N-acetylmuramoyl-L-alanine amidase